MGEIKGMHRFWNEKSEGKKNSWKIWAQKGYNIKICLEDIEWECMDRTYFIQDRKEWRIV